MDPKAKAIAACDRLKTELKKRKSLAGCAPADLAATLKCHFDAIADIAACGAACAEECGGGDEAKPV